MRSEITGFQAIYIYCGKCNLRKGIDGLATLVKEQFHLDPFQKDVLFLFCGCRTDRFKGLVWECDGFCLLYKMNYYSSKIPEMLCLTAFFKCLLE